jgi:arsenate reductase
MNIQIFGTKKNRVSQKAERWFKERGIPYHFVDVSEKGISPRELDSVARFIPPADLIDEDSPAYSKRGLAWMEYDPREEILADAKLLKLPVVRNGKDGATAGLAEDTWRSWADGAKQ